MKNPSSNSLNLALNFTLSESEFIAAHRAHLRASLLTGRNLAFLIVAATLSFGQAQVLSVGSGPLLFLVMILGAVLLLVGYVYVVMPSRIFRGKPQYSQPWRVLADRHGLSIEQPERDFIAWGQLQGVREIQQAILLLRKGALPLVIPKRSFENQESIESFIKQCVAPSPES
jgi:hypothetical protein